MASRAAAQRVVPPLREVVRHWSRVAGARVAVATATGDVSYAELATHTAALASQLQANGVGPDVEVAFAFDNSPAHVAWLFGVLESGGVAMPLDPRLSAAARDELLDQAGVAFLATPASQDGPQTGGWRLLNQPDGSGWSLWHRRPVTRQPAPDRRAAGEDHVLRGFTSGSTGEPKHILRTATQVTEDCNHYRDALGLTADDRYLALPPFYHSYGGLGLLATLLQGGAVHPVPRFLPAEVLAIARQFEPTLLLATPPMLDLLGRCVLRDGDRAAFRSVRHCICSTGPLSRAVYETFRARFDVPVRVQYGSTETMSTTITAGDGFAEGAVGRGYPGVEVRIFDDTGAALPPGAVGRVGICSPAACAGYASAGHVLNRIDGYVLPGDRGYLDEGGDLFVLGRDDVYNIGGYKVDRHEVESVIRSGLAVTFVAVLPFTRAGQPALRAVVEADPAVVTADAVVALCREKLIGYKVPARVDVRRVLPRDANGKVAASAVAAT